MKNRFGMFGGAFAAWAGMFAPLAAAPVIALNPSPEPLAPEHHHIRVTFEPGFARTEASIRIANPNFGEAEGVFWLPLPARAALAAASVDPAPAAEADYRALLETSEWDEAAPRAREMAPARREAGGARIPVGPIPGGGEATLRVLYYEPLAPERGRVNYAYASETRGAPAPEPGLISLSAGTISAELEPKTSYALAAIESKSAALVTLGDETDAAWTRAFTERDSALTSRGFEAEFASAEPLPARVELIAHRDDHASTGSFMLILTPGFGGGALERPELAFAGDAVIALTEPEPGAWSDGRPQIFFGRYIRPGRARLQLKGAIAGEEKLFAAPIDLPTADLDAPEIERLADAALARGAEGAADGGFARLQRERAAQARRGLMPAWNPRADLQQKFFIDRAGAETSGSCAMCVMAAGR